MQTFFAFTVSVLICIFIQIASSQSANAPPQDVYLNSGAQQVWYQNDLIFEDYYGKASVEFNADITYDTQYRICSNSKLFVAVSMMQLLEAGHYSSIHDNISDYLDETDLMAWGYPAGSKRFCPTIVNQTVCQNITFVSLMSMTAGIIPSITCPYNPSQWQYQYCLSPEWATIYTGSIGSTIASFIQHPLLWAPGPVYGPQLTSFTNYNYADENFIILSYFVQKFSGLSLQEYLSLNIFQPVGMSNTFYDPWSQAFNLGPTLAEEYFYYTDLSIPNNIDPFAKGLCWSVEAKAGLQTGSGGIVSTLSDMVKWYATLFVSKNASLLTQASLDQVIYPWALEAPFPGQPVQYYGLGIEMMFEIPPTSPPDVASPPSPAAIYYFGSSECMFVAMVLYMSTYNVFAPLSPVVTVPMLSVVGKNNLIMNITESVWLSTQNQSQGTWWQLTNYPYGWGGDPSSPLLQAFNLALYFASFSTVSPVSVPPTNDDDSSHSYDITLNKGVVVAIGIVPAILCIFLTSVVCLIMGRYKKQQTTTMATAKEDAILNPL